MSAGLYLDIIAAIPPIVGLAILFRRETTITGFTTGSIARLNMGFLAAVFFDALRVEGLTWANYGLLASLAVVFGGIGTLSFNLYLSPENQSLVTVIRNAAQHIEFYIYNGVVLSWLVVNLVFPAYYLPSTISLMVVILVVPTRLFRLAGRRASGPIARDMLTILQVSWISFVTVAFLFFSFGADPPVLGISIPFAWELAFSSTSSFFFLMSKGVTNPTGLTRVWESLVPGTVVKLGQKYIVLHDAGEKARTLLSASFASLIEAGVRIVIADLARSPLVEKTLGNDQRYEKWESDGKVVNLEAHASEGQLKEKAHDFLLRHSVGTVYVVELPDAKLDRVNTTMTDRVNTTGLFLVEKGVVPKPELMQFLQMNKGVQLLDLTTPKSPFSSKLNLSRSKLRGSAILLEHSSDSFFEESAQLFLTEAVSYGELSAVFTSKSTKLYRMIRGDKKVKIIASSSIISTPDQLPDGEVQIPDRELGLVTSIVSDLLDTAKGLPACIVLDSIMDMVQGDHWEQVYSGIKQIVELVSRPNVTTLVLANQDTLDPQFLGALKGLFQVLLKLDRLGLRVLKAPSQPNASSIEDTMPPTA